MTFIHLPATTFLMGTDDGIGFPSDFEGPQTQVQLASFKIATTTVTNREFADFVAETGYKTLAERLGNSFVFEGLVDDDWRGHYPHPAGAPWWLVVEGANWAHPTGPRSSVAHLQNHPVVHVALEDALAYCQWAGACLPTEAQWEYAAGAGSQTTFPWGNELQEAGKYHANTWQGTFPWKNSALDGFVGTAPVKTFEPNKNGLYQMIGNVWEWCRNPRGVMLASFNNDAYPLHSQPSKGEYAIRGGSFLCHCSYCNRYRTAARNGADYQSTSSHLGFRVIKE